MPESHDAKLAPPNLTRAAARRGTVINPTCLHTEAEVAMDPFLGGWGHGCRHVDHQPCRDRTCFFVGMGHCHALPESPDAKLATAKPELLGFVERGINAWLARFEPSGDAEMQARWRTEAIGGKRHAQFWMAACAEMAGFTDVTFSRSPHDPRVTDAYGIPPERA